MNSGESEERSDDGNCTNNEYWNHNASSQYGGISCQIPQNESDCRIQQQGKYKYIFYIHKLTLNKAFTFSQSEDHCSSEHKSLYNIYLK